MLTLYRLFITRDTAQKCCPKTPPCQVSRRAEVLLSTFLLVVALAGCTRLPDYATPQIASQPTEYKSFIPYRILKQSDFKAQSLTGKALNKEKHLNARSNIQIRPVPSTQIIVRRSTIGGTPVFIGNVLGLKLQAVFIPEASWWSPFIPPKKTPYVLQHEQIHFALMELTARKINQDIANTPPDFSAIGNTAEEAQTLATMKMKDFINGYNSEIIKEHTAFDKDASLFYAPKIQARWWQDVANRLSSSEQEN